ncbi:hypothetical protein ITP53_48085 [Nonomuraea sp. K274]|uniref:Septum formation initiator n=1 Tax=Nonomuraea cypriaca TaxID=1187855 RepID=A0A931AKB3_9ACTN|nr:hypothetical protein [Nonomuraea cypriaca]MBF8193305.1 hypothetical protein [Nonomuraea cypriaca]
MTTEQETGRGAPVRRAVPKTGTRRPRVPHQSKQRPRPDARPDVEAKRTAAERAGAGVRSAPGVESARPGSESALRTRPRVTGQRSEQPSRPVPRRRPARRQRAPFVLLVVGLLCGGLVSLLLLNTMLAKDTITDASLREEIQVARREKEQIEQEYQLKTQPEVIAQLAENQGQHRDWDRVNNWSSAGDEAGQVDTER